MELLHYCNSLSKDDLQAQDYSWRLKKRIIRTSLILEVFFKKKKNSLRARAADIRFLGSLFNRCLTKSFASEDKEGQGASSKHGSASKTALKIPDSARTQNRQLPHNGPFGRHDEIRHDSIIL